MPRTHYVVAYDVESNKRRRKLARLLEGYGDRLQLSVFELDLSRDELQDLLGRASKLIEETDSLRAYPTCAACRVGAVSIGRQAPEEIVGARII